MNRHDPLNYTNAELDEMAIRSERTPAPVEIFWHGDERKRKARPWLVKEMIPETGQGLASGQWGAGKTFAAIDLSASVMTATPFAGREVARRGGVLFIAAEGASEIPIRLQGVVEHKLRPDALVSGAAGNPTATDLDRLPFAWIEDCPSLKDEASFEQLMALAKSAANQITEKFDLPLVLIIIDTLSASADFADANDAAEGQRIMNRLNALSRRTGAFTLAVDHFGKAVETGTRGTSAKEGAADVVLALLADRLINGTISNTRLAVRKLRGGKTGEETPFNLRVVDIGDSETTCIIEWRASMVAGATDTARKERWPKSLKIFRSAMGTALAEHGKVIQPFPGPGPTVRAVPDSAVRAEFTAAYPADPSTKRKAFTRALKTAVDRDLICSREVLGIDQLWFVESGDGAANHADKTGHL
jgi:AAA domain